MRDYLARLAALSYNARVYLLCSLFGNIAYTGYMLVYNLYLAGLGYQNNAIGYIIAIPGISMAAASYPVARLSDRWGRKPFIVWSAAIFALSLVGMAFAERVGPIAILALVGGIAGGMLWVLAGPFMVENSQPEERMHLFSLNFALVMGSGVIGSMSAGWAPQMAARLLAIPPTATEALRWGLLLAALMQTVGLIAALYLRPYTIPRHDAESALARILAHRGLLTKLILPHVTLAFGAGAMVLFFNLFFSQKFHLTPGTIGILYAISSGCTAVASLASPWLAGRMGRIRAVVLVQCCSIPFLLVIAYVPILAPVMVAYWVRGALMNMSDPIYNTFALEQVPPDLKSTLASLYSMTWNLGWVFGPALSGWLQIKGGFPLAFSVTVVCYVVSIATTAGFFWNAENKPGRGA